jgi:ribosome maturation factor RimP
MLAVFVMVVAFAGAVFAADLKVGDEVQLCEKGGKYSILAKDAKCDGKAVKGKIAKIDGGKITATVDGKEVAVEPVKK